MSAALTDCPPGPQTQPGLPSWPITSSIGITCTNLSIHITRP